MRHKLLLIFVSFFSSSIIAHAKFTNQTSELGLKLNNTESAFIDFDNDGWVDLYNPPFIWRNEEGQKFSKSIKIGGKCIFADINNDGFPDALSFSNRKMFKNEGGKKVTPLPFPKLPIRTSLGACFGNFNGDEFVDIYIGGYEDWKKNLTFPDAMLINIGGKTFRKTFDDKRYRARGVTGCDFNNDGYTEIYVSNYRLMPNILWQSEAGGKLTDITKLKNAVATKKGFRGGHSIGACWADFDNNGNFDIFAGNFAHRDSRGDQPQSVFLRNKGEKDSYAFDDMGQCGLHYQESYASPAAADFDNDGDVDLFFTTVYDTASFGKKNEPVLYRNDGNWKFTNVTKETGLNGLRSTYQACWADINNDGHIDLLANGKLFVNGKNSNNWLKIKLRGDGKVINTDAIGAQARIKLGDKTLSRQVEAGTGQGNQNDMTLHFGLGSNTAPVELEIFWGKELIQKLENIKPCQLLNIKFDKDKCK
ncbi:MAG: CRTAC1 family protein [Sedimentisphaeraceae bacterium JB056]